MYTPVSGTYYQSGGPVGQVGVTADLCFPAYLVLLFLFVAVDHLLFVISILNSMHIQQNMAYFEILCGGYDK